MTNAERTAKYRLENPAKTRSLLLRWKYGLTLEDWEALFDSQGRVCAICKSEDHKHHLNWCTDHDHVTGKVRGILCNSCNNGLSRFEDNPQSLRNAA